MFLSRYYVDVFNASGYNELVENFGSWFSLDHNPRAQIFRRNQTAVTDVDSMIRLMRLSFPQLLWRITLSWPALMIICEEIYFSLIRYNNFKEDPLSQCEGCDPPANGENAISARSDLNSANGTYPFGALRQRQHGGTDMKVFLHKFFLCLSVIVCTFLSQKSNVFVQMQLTSYKMFRDYGLIAVSGPTWDQVPPFQWSTSPYKDLLHMGHPDTWTFKPITVTWTP